MGWHHNLPALTLAADRYEDDSDNHGSWVETVTGPNPDFIGSAAPAALGPGMTRYDEGYVRTRYLYGWNDTAGIPGSAAPATLQHAIDAGAYLHYRFTTSTALPAGTFLRKLYWVSYADTSFKYTALLAENGDFNAALTLISDAQVNAIGGTSADHNTWSRWPAFTAASPVLRPGTTYDVRVYFYDVTSRPLLATGIPPEHNPNLPPAASIPANTPSPEPVHDKVTLRPTIDVIAADDFQIGMAVCPPPTLTVGKRSNTRTGTFSFSGGNGFGTQSISTTTAGVTVSHAPVTLTAGYTATTVTEADDAAALFKLAAITCPGLAAGQYSTTPASLPVSGTGGGSVTLSADALPWGANVSCTFTNDAADADLSVSKSNTTNEITSGTQTTYTVQVHNAGPGPAHGASLKDAPSAGLTNCATVTGSCSASTGASCPAALEDVLTSSGAVIPLLPAGGSVQLQVRCDVP